MKADKSRRLDSAKLPSISTRSRRPSTGGKIVRFLRNFFFLITAFFVLVTVIVVLAFRWANPPTSSFMLQAAYPIKRHQWVAWENISPNLPMAVIAAEDQNFPNHWGFDFEQLSLAWKQRQTSGRMRGASTISQQVAKNLFLWPKRSYARKLLEAYLTLLLEAMWSKQRILEIYLNVAQFGPGVFGVNNAAHYFYQRRANQLSLRDAALLAAVLPRPTYRTLDKPTPYLNQRAARIQLEIRRLGGTQYLRRL